MPVTRRCFGSLFRCSGFVCEDRLNFPLTDVVLDVGPVALEFKPRTHEPMARLNSHDVFGMREPLALLVQQQVAAAIPEGIVHAASYEQIRPAVSVEVTRTGTPRPAGFDTGGI